jgi:hypothetical protein
LIQADLRLPEGPYPILSSHVVFAIGVKSGRALGSAELADPVAPLVASIVLDIVTPLVAFALLRRLGRPRSRSSPVSRSTRR